MKKKFVEKLNNRKWTSILRCHICTAVYQQSRKSAHVSHEDIKVRVVAVVSIYYNRE